jgi:two-component system, chemotaxis family, protein-glutamate methylesterase/glutaminase
MMSAVDAIVIGASAGGVEALSALLPSLNAGFSGAVFIVLHIPRDRPSLLIEIFSPKCRLRVREPEDKEPVASGTVYFAPPDYHMLVDDGPQIALSADEPVHFSRPSIDALFESAADVYGDRLLAIILTGASRDGAQGIDAIRRAGGKTIAQDPATAVARTMIEAALQLGAVDRILDLDGIARLLHDTTQNAIAQRTEHAQ